MSFARRLTQSDRGRAVVCWTIAAYIRLIHATSRWREIGGEEVRRVWAEGPSIFTFWHGRLLMVPYAWPASVPGRMLISGHRDGRIIAGAIARFGYGSIAGSTSKGGGPALRSIMKTLKEGQSVGITPDGPRGPAMRASAGVVAVARLAQVPIMPFSFATSRRRVLGSWDRFHLALPFSRGVFVWGEPIRVPRDGDLETWRLVVEECLNRLTAEADREVGRDAVEPAPLPGGGASPEAQWESTAGTGPDVPVETGARS